MLQKIYILTSAEDNPEDPTLDKNSNWMIRSYRDKAYGPEATVILESDVLVRHVAVYSVHTEHLSLAEVEVYEQDYNLAYGKATCESSTYDTRPPSIAVDGVIAVADTTDYWVTHTKNKEKQFWIVDIGDQHNVQWIELYNRQTHRDRLLNITVWGSNKETVSTTEYPSTTDWEVISTQDNTIVYLHAIELSNVRKFRHISVSKEQKGILSFKEVQVFSKKRINYATKGTAYQESTLSENSIWSAGFAIDGTIDSSFSNTGESNTGEWWKVDLGRKVIFQFARIFARTDDCNGNPCAGRLKRMHYLTNSEPHDVTKPPNGGSNNNWKRCRYFSNSQGVMFNVLCELNVSPYIQQFAILTDNNKGVAFREVEIYGYDHIPTFSVEKNVSIVYPDYTSVTASFSQWNLESQPWLFNCNPKVNYSNLQYEASLTGENNMNANKENGKVSFTATQLNEETFYRFLVSHRTGSSDTCPGPVISLPVMTKQCTVPDPPSDLELTAKKLLLNGAKKWQYTATWMAPTIINCDSTKNYEWTVTGGSTKITSDRMATFTADAGGVSITFSVWTINNGNKKSDTPATQTFITDSLPSDAPTVTVDGKSEDSVTLSWEPPENTYGTILKYQFMCTNMTDWKNVSSEAYSQNVNGGYQPYQQVTCQVRVVYEAGEGDSGESSSHTACAAPKFVGEINYIDEYVYQDNWKSYREVTISKNQSILSNCGPNKTTELSFKRKGSPHMEFLTQNVFPNLMPNTMYHFEVEAKNEQNQSSTKTLTVITNNIEPTVPPSITLELLGDDCINVSLNKPGDYTGAITYYLIECGYTNTAIDIPSLNLTSTNQDKENNSIICNLASASLIECTAQVGSVYAPSPASPPATTVTELIIKNQSLLTGPVVTTKKVAVTIAPVQTETVNIRSYLILVQKKTRSKRAVSSSNCIPSSDSQSVSRASLTLTQSCYITAEILANDTKLSTPGGYEFNVGDGKSYNGYINTKLSSATEYDVWIATTWVPNGSEDEYVKVISEGHSFKAPEFAPVPDDIPPSTTSKPSNATRIGGAIGGVVAIVAAVVVVILAIKRKTLFGKEKDNSSDNELTNLQQAESANSSVSRGDNPGAEYENVEELSPPNITRITVRELGTFIINNVGLMKTQFQKLEALPKPKMEVALLPQNGGKCRYKLLYPADDHRVVLTREGEGNDFINASYIAGYNRDNAYIAAQGPTGATVNDFWYMVWQERPSAIVMVTRAVESGKSKCEQYWPLDKQPKKFGDVTVCSKSVECWADFTQTRLSISKDGETRTLSHFNYLSWPDHGVPDDLSSYVAFYFKIKSLVSHSTNPLLIHCSAGVGRTGTYIALEYLIQQAKREEAVDVFGCVEAMRKRRPCMVQKDDQYIFLHEVLAESLAVEGFKSSPSEINDKIEAHEQRETQDQPNSILQEFQHMESRLQSMQFKYTIAQEEDNLGKNRFPNIFPCDKYMPFLTNGQGLYINAVFVDSYTCKHQFIATQLPLSNTLSNFWQLIIEQDVKVIVQLEHAEMPFFPMTDLATLSTSLHSLVRGTAEEKEHVIIIPLKIQTSQLEKSIFILQMKAWCDTAEQYPTGEALLSLCGAGEDILKKTDRSKKTCVTCLDGSKRCGVFISATNSIEKLKNEQEIDVYSPTMMAKTRRPQFVSTIEDYLFIYQVLKNYADSFAEYANFN